MSKEVVRIRTGEPIPEGARYLHSQQEHDKENQRKEYKFDDGGLFFGSSMTTYTITPVATFHYYEVEMENKNG